MNNQKDIIKIKRMVDANLNRAREGLRVVEDILRFCYDDKLFCPILRTLRHELALNIDISVRRSEKDVGSSYLGKSSENDLYGLVCANLKRAQEALRVLEESAKLVELKCDFQKIRFQTYTLEQEIVDRYFKEQANA